MSKASLYKFLIPLLMIVFLSITTITASAQEAGGTATDTTVWKAIGAGLAVGLAGIGAGYAVGVAGASGLSALAEKPEMTSNVILIVALGEGIAIYGLLVAILIIFVL